VFIKLVRLGKDAEVKHTQSGQAVCNLNVAYDVGWGERKKTQWMSLSLWGDRAEKSAEHLTKGKAIVARVDDLHLDTFEGNNGPVTTLKGTLVSFEFAGGNQQQDRAAAPASEPAQRPAAQQAPAAQPQGFDDFTDDIPF
jgi:single-strand DNA-binding protein